MKIVHIGPDSQFVQFAAGVFENAAPGANDYIIVSDSRVEELRFPIRAGRVRVVPSRIGSATMPIVQGVRSGDMIVAHAMTRHAAIGFAASRRDAVKVWSGWGYEYYGSDMDPNLGLLEPLTSRLASAMGLAPGESRRLVDLKRRLYRPLIHYAAASAAVFSAPVPGDFPVFKARFPEFKGQYSQICYASVEESFVNNTAPAISPNILVGNSASVTGNHLDVFQDLARMDLTGRKVIVPLSLGSSEYRKQIVEQCIKLFGSQFHALVDFIPLADYNAVVGGCGVVIMNHIRQQALGNICTALYAGAHVVLNEKSPIFIFLRSRGVTLMSTQDLRSHGLPESPLSIQDMVANRDALKEFWGANRVLENVRSLLTIAEDWKS